MDERVVQFRVGVMVLATIIITGILILLFNEFPSMGAGTYTIHVRFSSAPGVAKDTPVRRSGILIGRVTDVEFDEKYNVIATLEINRDHTIPIFFIGFVNWRRRRANPGVIHQNIDAAEF